MATKYTTKGCELFQVTRDTTTKKNTSFIQNVSGVCTETVTMRFMFSVEQQAAEEAGFDVGSEKLVAIRHRKLPYTLP